MLEHIGGKYFGHIPLQSCFRYKYHDHNYNDCRLIDMNNIRISDEINSKTVEPFISNIINIYIVCSYYSTRYNSADNYLIECNDYELSSYSLFLKNNTPHEIVDLFIDSKIQNTSGSDISMKNILYLWKCFLNEKNIPNIIFLNNLKRLLKERLKYRDDDDNFNGYTSPSIPIVSEFIKFWDTNINEHSDDFFLEIDELLVLFKQYLLKENKSSFQVKLIEQDLINLIRHFYPTANIEDNKFIIGVKCDKWDKKQMLIEYFKEYLLLKKDDTTRESISVYDLYYEYTKRYKKEKLVISKLYFELFVNDYFKNEITDNMLLLDTYYDFIIKKLILNSEQLMCCSNIE